MLLRPATAKKDTVVASKGTADWVMKKDPIPPQTIASTGYRWDYKLATMIKVSEDSSLTAL
jgi:hypothetical protein